MPKSVVFMLYICRYYLLVILNKIIETNIQNYILCAILILSIRYCRVLIPLN